MAIDISADAGYPLALQDPSYVPGGDYPDVNEAKSISIDPFNHTANADNVPNSSWLDNLKDVASAVSTVGKTYRELRNGGATEKPQGQSPVYVGVPNPGPNWNPLGKIFAKFAQPNSNYDVPRATADSGGFSLSPTMIIAGVVLLALVLIRR